MIIQARCNRGRGSCRINIEFPDGAERINVRYSCYNQPCDKSGHNHSVNVRPDSPYGPAGWFIGEIILKDAGPYYVSCVTHKDMMHFKKLRTSRSNDACSADCLEAEGDKCKCSCGGLNHGTEAK